MYSRTGHHISRMRAPTAAFCCLTNTSPCDSLVYSGYGGHGLKVFLICPLRDDGSWIYEAAVLTARASDYTGYDQSHMSTKVKRLNLFMMGDKGLASRGRNFVVPYTTKIVKKLLR